MRVVYHPMSQEWGTWSLVLGMHEAGTCNPTSGFSQSVGMVETSILDPHVHITQPQINLQCRGRSSWAVFIYTCSCSLSVYLCGTPPPPAEL